MILVIFVTKRAFKMSQEFPTLLWYYPLMLFIDSWEDVIHDGFFFSGRPPASVGLNQSCGPHFAIGIGLYIHACSLGLTKLECKINNQRESIALNWQGTQQQTWISLSRARSLSLSLSRCLFVGNFFLVHTYSLVPLSIWGFKVTYFTVG